MSPATILSYLRRPGRIPWRFAAWYGGRQLMRRLGLLALPDPMTDDAVRSASAAGLRQGQRAAFFAGADDFAALDRPAWHRHALAMGRRAMAHEFDYAGFGSAALGADIDWRSDPFCDPDRDGEPDLRAIWELNRCSHFAALGLAYACDKDESLVDELLAQMRSWVQANPLGEGPNWASSMEASIRIINWIWAMRLVRESDRVTDEAARLFMSQVAGHGAFIRRHLERSAVSNNHYIAGAVGLLHVGVLFPELREAAAWRRIGSRVLYSQVLAQTYPDGAGFEGSMPYHGFVLELVLPSLVLCRANGVTVPGGVERRIERMCDFVLAYTRPDGSFPNIGDRDDGHLLRLSSRSPDSHTHLLALAAVLFRRADFKRAAGDWDIEAQLLLGEAGRRIFDSLSAGPAASASAAFAESGYYFMRKDHAHMAIDCAGVGLRGRGGHGHNDCLSFELHAHGRTLLVDSGAYRYAVPEETRRCYQATAAHNTATVDDEEMAPFVPGNKWGIQAVATPTVHAWRHGDDFDLLVASHAGYERLEDPVGHRRRFLFDRDAMLWLIRDDFTCAGPHQFRIFFHLAPGFLARVQVSEDRGYVVTTAPDGPNIALIPMETSAIDISVVDGRVSRRYGHSEAAPVVCFAARQSAPWHFEACLATLDGTGTADCGAIRQQAEASRRRWASVTSPTP